MKVIIIGMSLSGKTTIVKHLRGVITTPVLEFDEELTRLNDGVYPTDNRYKTEVLVPQIINSITNKGNIIFFTNTNYFSVSDLEKAKRKGFIIIQLGLSLTEALRRNQYRVKNEGYSDLSKWFKGMLEYQNYIVNTGVVDKIIDAAQPIDRIVNQILRFL